PDAEAPPRTSPATTPPRPHQQPLPHHDGQNLKQSGNLSANPKWRNFKLKLMEQEHMLDSAVLLPFGHIVNLVTDPHEREPINPRFIHTWTKAHFGRLISEFKASVAREPLIPPGAPLDHIPTSPSST
ncbi:MAG: hypothetical protein ACRD2Z_00620, partial [Thermoanaerobaculia bacterium]